MDKFLQTKEISNEKIQLLDYKGYLKKNVFKCNTCNNVFEKTFQQFKEVPTCANCKTIALYNRKKQEIKDKSNGKIELITYNGKRSYSLFKCVTCNNEFEQKFEHFNDYPICLCCKEREFTEEKIKEVEECSKGKFKMISYKGYKKNSTFKCNKCNKEFEKRYDHFKESLMCPHCDAIYLESKNERKIKEILEQDNIIFSTQYRIDECRNKFTLPFDFALLNAQEKLLCLIEYDGEDHFHVVNRMGDIKRAKANFKRRQINDKIKDEYCKNNGIPLIRISYMEQENIEDIMRKVINTYGVVA